ncbi:MAG: transcription termination/antitermination protein NusA, partial [Deltaproteobacteria bacterium]
IDQVVREKGIDRSIIIEALEAALLTAARRKYSLRDIEAYFNEDLGEIELFEFRDVVENPENPYREISLEEARRYDPGAEMGDSIGMKMAMDDFGRIAAQTAKQVIIQRLRDAERENTYRQYKDRTGEILSGLVRRFERRDIIVEIGKDEAILPYREQIPRESYCAGERIRAYVKEVRRDPRPAGPQIVLSRTDPNFLVQLFTLEVPEIYEGIVRIESVAREPGSRSKIAVSSRDPDVDPVGACVGIKGSRVQAVVQELRGEKIDIVPYSTDTATFLCNALAPAIVSKIIIDQDAREVEVVVADDQLSLAIGRKGQNVRLASQLTGWRIDIKSESSMERLAEVAMLDISQIPEIGELLVKSLHHSGFNSIEDIANADIESLEEVTGDRQRALEIREGARSVLEGRKEAARLKSLERKTSEAEEVAVASETGQEEPQETPSASPETQIEEPVASATHENATQSR